jgi:hypothetical protein
MFQQVNNTPEELIAMESNVHQIINWSTERMNHLVDHHRIDDATSIYDEFSEWYSKDLDLEIVVIDDCFS